MPNYISSIINGVDPMVGDRMIAARQDRQRNKLGMEIDQAKLDQYKKQDAISKLVGQQIDTGDLTGARSTALQAGNLDYAKEISQIMQQQSEAERKQTQRLLEHAAILHESGVQGDAFNKAMRNFGADAEDLQHLQAIPSKAYRGLAMGAKTFLEGPKGKGFTLSPGETRYGPDNKPIASLPGREKETDQWEQLTPAETQKLGFASGTILQRNSKTGQLRPLQKPAIAQGVRDTTGNINMRAQGHAYSLVAQAFGGIWNPQTGQISGLEPDQAKQALGVASRAVAILQSGTTNSVSAAVLRALKESQGDTAGPAEVPAPAPQPAAQAATPDVPSPPQEPAASSRQRARNPQTGEVIEFNPDTGQWEPAR